jgi:hypothetical protein
MRPAPRPAERLEVAVPVMLKDSGTSSKTEINTMMPVENPMPIAVIFGLSPMTMAGATPIKVVPPDRKASATTARYEAGSESIVGLT